MAKETTMESAGMEQPGIRSCAGLKESALLAPFPLWLQEVIINAILDSRCERATDIWCEDEATKTVHVMRSNMQWHLNETASQLWMHLGETRVGDLVDRIGDSYQGCDRNEVRFHCIEFLLSAFQSGLINFPNPRG